MADTQSRRAFLRIVGGAAMAAPLAACTGLALVAQPAAAPLLFDVPPSESFFRPHVESAAEIVARMERERAEEPRIRRAAKADSRRASKALADARGLPFSTFLGQLIREEAARRGVTKRAKRRER